MTRQLNSLELTWLQLLLSDPFPGWDIIQEQLKVATIISETTSPYISLKFATTFPQPFPYQQRIPAQMLAIQPNGDSVDFILHIVDGYIDELEAYSTSGFAITPDNISLDNIRHNILLNPGDSFLDEWSVTS